MLCPILPEYRQKAAGREDVDVIPRRACPGIGESQNARGLREEQDPSRNTKLVRVKV